MFGKMFHFGSIKNVMYRDITIEVTNDHTLFETVKYHSSDFVLTDINKYFRDIAIEGTPDFDFVTWSSDKACGLFDISDSNYKILVSSVRVVVFVVFINRQRFADEDQFDWLINCNETW